MHSCFPELQKCYATRLTRYLGENTRKGFIITQAHSTTVGVYYTSLKMCFKYHTTHTVNFVHLDTHCKTLNAKLWGFNNNYNHHTNNHDNNWNIRAGTCRRTVRAHSVASVSCVAQARRL